jgi:serine/threonine protein kinase
MSFDPNASTSIPPEPYQDEIVNRARELLDAPPESIGPYRILERIGGGGMGEVYRAEQRTPIRREVALKFIKLGMDTKAVIARFEAERQALALMDHPHIAKVFDAGADDSGRPYFVMEYVKGKPITDYADQNHLTIPERLELFEQVCQAIQHAHHKGIIHRDLKPSNVLVSTHDGKPFARVIDFGIAKAISQQLTDKTLFTRHDQFVGTPQYMSPEQAEGSLDIDTRTDVYSLGVLLYELLTGSTPFSTEKLRLAAFEQIKKLIVEVHPPKPSTRLSLTEKSLPTLATFRRTEPKRLGTLVRGELDWIVMKALEKDRKRRYETPNSLANDILAQLKGEPVQAAPPSAAYRIRKFVKRHRVQVFAGGAIACSLVIGIIGTTWGLVRARIAESNAIASEQKAIEEGDAKEIARLAERQQREKTELHLIQSILRPIGYNRYELDPAELNSFIEWSALGDSRLQLRILEGAFDNPVTALRVARRAEYVIQAAIGLSPLRRAKAIALTSAKQRSTTTDPRTRIAACWLALELGSADVPALHESLRYLGDENHKSVLEFDEFVTLLVGRTDPQQEASITQGGETLAAVLEKSTNHVVLDAAGEGLAALAPRLEPAIVTRGWEALIALLEKSTNVFILDAAGHGLAALAPHLDEVNVARGGMALIAILQRSTEIKLHAAAGKGLRALAPRLDPTVVAHGWDVQIALLEKSTNHDVVRAAGERLAELAPRLELADMMSAWDALIALLEKSTNDDVRDAVGIGLAALAPRLQPADLTRGWDSLIALLDKSTTFNVNDAACKGLKALAPRLEDAVIARGGEALIALLEKSTDDDVLYAAGGGLAALALRLEPAVAARGWDALVALLEKSTDDDVLRPAACKGLAALALRLEPAVVARGWDSLIALLRKSTNHYVLLAAGEGLVALTPRLDAVFATRMVDALIAVLDNSSDPRTLSATTKVLAAIASRLTPADVERSWDAIVSVLNKSKSLDYDATEPAESGLETLAPQLPKHLLNSSSVKIVKLLANSEVSATSKTCWRVLATINRLNHDAHPEQTHPLLPSMLDLCLMRPDNSRYSDAGSKVYAFDPAAIEAVVIAIHDRKQIARLLAHPACTGEIGGILLQRFEELVLHDGKPVFLKPEPDSKASDDDKASITTPVRVFHNVHDAAAWIAKNWPDFDLETNHPVTWRGER